jgi:hypothetical protein
MRSWSWRPRLCWTGGASWTVARPRAEVVSLEVVALADGTTRCDAADVIADVARDMLLICVEMNSQSPTVKTRRDMGGVGRGALERGQLDMTSLTCAKTRLEARLPF